MDSEDIHEGSRPKRKTELDEPDVDTPAYQFPIGTSTAKL
jgi:hypothetical protein